MTRAVFLYDGDCAFCSACADFIKRRIPTSARVQAWQSIDIEPLGRTPAQCAEAVQWIAADGGTPGAASAGPAAIAALLRSSSRRIWQLLGRLLGSRPGLLVADPAYRWVSRNRHRLPGGTPACSVAARPDINPVTLGDDRH